MKLPINLAIAQISRLRLALHPQTKKATLLTGITLLLGLLSACTQSQSTPIIFSLKVESSGRPGIYLASGTTNLPDCSRIVISGIRYLQPFNDSTPLRPIDANATAYATANYATANYAILDRGVAEVNQGKWEAKLNLWQRNSDGSYYETWQPQQQSFGRSFRASEQVAFTAIVEPENQSVAIRQHIQKQNLQSSLLRFTESGQPYLQASQVLPVSIPAEKITPLATSSFDQNSTWENRARLKPTSSGGVLVLPKKKQIDSPVPIDGFVR